MISRLGLMTSGGDCAGLNAAIRAVVRRATRTHGMEVVGIEDGGAGLVERRFRPLSPDLFDQGGFDPMLNAGGTILGSINRSIGDVEAELDAGYREGGFDALVAIGGDGSLRILEGQATAMGWNLVCVPKTIDNDVALTERCIGFDSAVATATTALAHLRTTGVSHDRVMVLETMGRGAGHLALHAGVAGGADAILLPEVPYSLDELFASIERTREVRRHAFALIVVAEGCPAPDGQPVFVPHPERGPSFGGIGRVLADAIEQAWDGRIEARSTVLGHLQRGGPPTHNDTILATAFGVRAVDLAAAGQFGQMVAWQAGAITSVPLGEVVAHGARLVAPDDQLIATARAMGVYVGGPSSVQTSESDGNDGGDAPKETTTDTGTDDQVGLRR